MPFSHSKYSKNLSHSKKRCLKVKKFNYCGDGGYGGDGGSGVDNETLTLVSLPVDVSLFLHVLLPVVSLI